jgi:ubiquinone/menaquinone biosynthesis C-methylase UbiE
MSTQASEFVGSIPENYDSGLGPRIFFDYADDLATRVAKLKPRSVLELAAGTGIVTRRLRDALPDHCQLLASDLNAPMLEIAQKKFDSEESVLFETADATKLQFDDELFDTVTCQFGVMFFPDKEQSYSEVFRVLKPEGHYVFNVWGSWEKIHTLS